jgi:hypothetical protein
MSQRESAIRLKVNHPRPVEEEEEMRSKYLAINAFRLVLLVGCGVWALAIAKVFELLGH